MVSAIYKLTRKVLSDTPILILSKFGLVIHDRRKQESFHWVQVLDWKVEKDEDGPTYYLKLQTTESNRKINISWLDKRPEEIESLLQVFTSSQHRG